MQVYQALLLGQERLHEQMRVHQAQHEEQQRRQQQREAEKRAQATVASTAAAAPQHVMNGQVPTSGAASPAGGVHGRGEFASEDGSFGSGGRAHSTGGRGRGTPPFVPTSDATSSGGKMPRRIPSEPHSLAAMGVAGMGGRHQVRLPFHPHPSPQPVCQTFPVLPTPCHNFAVLNLAPDVDVGLAQPGKPPTHMCEDTCTESPLGKVTTAGRASLVWASHLCASCVHPLLTSTLCCSRRRRGRQRACAR